MRKHPEKNRSSEAAVFCVDHRLLSGCLLRDRLAADPWKNIAVLAVAVAADRFAGSALAIEDGDETKWALLVHSNSFVGNGGLGKMLIRMPTISKP